MIEKLIFAQKVISVIKKILKIYFDQLSYPILHKKL